MNTEGDRGRVDRGSGAHRGHGATVDKGQGGHQGVKEGWMAATIFGF